MATLPGCKRATITRRAREAIHHSGATFAYMDFTDEDIARLKTDIDDVHRNSQFGSAYAWQEKCAPELEGATSPVNHAPGRSVRDSPDDKTFLLHAATGSGK